VVASRAAVTPEFQARFEDAARRTHRRFLPLVGDRYGVRWIDQFWLADEPFEFGWDRARVADLFPGTQVLSPDAHPFDAPFVLRDRTLLIEPPIFLPALISDVRAAGGRVVQRSVQTVAALATFSEPLIFNCTGLGSHALFGDREMIPVRGQLTLLHPQPEVDYVMARDDIYMFPRRDGIVLGGTFEPDVWDLTPDPVAERRVLAAHAEVFGAMRRPTMETASGLEGWLNRLASAF
jgi:D-amino-acid oxidase